MELRQLVIALGGHANASGDGLLPSPTEDCVGVAAGIRTRRLSVPGGSMQTRKGLDNCLGCIDRNWSAKNQRTCLPRRVWKPSSRLGAPSGGDDKTGRDRRRTGRLSKVQEDKNKKREWSKQIQRVHAEINCTTRYGKTGEPFATQANRNKSAAGGVGAGDEDSPRAVAAAQRTARRR